MFWLIHMYTCVPLFNASSKNFIILHKNKSYPITKILVKFAIHIHMFHFDQICKFQIY